MAPEKQREQRPIILLGHDPIERISADAARYAGRKERGGILLGYRRGPHLEVNEATLPMLWDWGSMFSFRRSARGHQSIALGRWRNSGQTVDWLGEWHSHPEPLPSPSGIDLGSWRNIVRNRGAPMAFLIVGYEGIWLGLSLPGRAAPIRYEEVERSTAGIAYAPI